MHTCGGGGGVTGESVVWACKLHCELSPDGYEPGCVVMSIKAGERRQIHWSVKVQSFVMEQARSVRS